MERLTLTIPKISCGHCVNAIKEELEGIDGVARVEGDAQRKSITVEWDSPATRDKILGKLKEINYPPA